MPTHSEPPTDLVGLVCQKKKKKNLRCASTLDVANAKTLVFKCGTLTPVLRAPPCFAAAVDVGASVSIYSCTYHADEICTSVSWDEERSCYVR